MCIAGVFGGLDSGVSDSTTNIFLESAYFNPVSIRKTAKRHTLSTDSSFRFERGCDPNMTIYALKRASLLIKEIAGGEISSEIVDIYPNEIKHFEVELTYNKLDSLIGEKIEREERKSGGKKRRRQGHQWMANGKEGGARGRRTESGSGAGR